MKKGAFSGSFFCIPAMNDPFRLSLLFALCLPPLYLFLLARLCVLQSIWQLPMSVAPPLLQGGIGSASGLLKYRGFPSTSTANGQDCCHLLTPFPEIAGNTISYLLLAGKQERQREKLLFRAGNMPSAGKGRAGCRLLGGKQRARLILRAEDRLYTKASPAHWMEKDR